MISNLPFLSKVLERAVLPQMLKFLHLNDLFPTFQSAYRPNHSTETALLRVQNDLLRMVDDGNEAILVLLDFSAAFDTIDHGLLLERLTSRFGFKGTVISWLKSYLSNRSQYIDINNVLSSSYPLAFGVPQGSVLGPVLFCLYISPLEDIFKSHGLSVMTYADDTQLYVVIRKQQLVTARTAIENCILDIKAWCGINMLVLNDGKTEVMHIHSKFMRSISHHTGITVGQSTITPKSDVRNLGVIFNQHLAAKSQITNCCKVSFMALSNISKIRRYLSQQQAEKLVHAFVTSRIDHCNSLLYGAPQKDLNKLQRVLNAAARVIRRPKADERTKDVLCSLHWLPIAERIVFKILLLVYKIRYGLSPTYLASLLEDYTAKRSLRSSNKGLYKVNSSNTKTYGDRAFSVAAPRLWNSLPDNIRNSDSIPSFLASSDTSRHR